jgi:rRNA small subunit pseudouridine methyltransferase Nep1
MSKKDNNNINDESDSEEEEINYNKLKGKTETNSKSSSKRIQDTGHKLYIILEHANLELTKDKKNPEIINSDDHMNLIKKMGKSYEDYRPDVLHQCLLNLFESPLNKSGMLQVFIRTKENVLIEISPKTKIPKTIKRFNGLMGQLLQHYRIRALNSSEVLLKIIKNPITQYIPFGCPIISTNEKSKLIKLEEYINSLKSNNIAFVVGAISKGDINIDYNTDTISISSFPLTAGIVCSKICTAVENCWDVI